MAWQPQFYPEGWSRMKQEALEHANYQCELCGARRGEERRNTRTDERYFVYLSVCHRLFYTTWKQDADTIVLCQRCHNRFDAKYRKRFKLSQQTPIGKANLYIYDGGKTVLFAQCRTYVELLAAVDALEAGRMFEIHLEINKSIVGNGFYVRTRTGARAIREYAACEMLYLTFAVIPQKALPHHFRSEAVS